MEFLILNWKYSEYGIKFFAKSKFIEDIFKNGSYTYADNFKGETIKIYDQNFGLNELYYNDEKFYDQGDVNLSFIRLVGLSEGIYFDIRNKATNGIMTKSMVENYINNVKNRLPEILRLIKNE